MNRREMLKTALAGAACVALPAAVIAVPARRQTLREYILTNGERTDLPAAGMYQSPLDGQWVLSKGGSLYHIKLYGFTDDFHPVWWRYSLTDSDLLPEKWQWKGSQPLWLFTPSGAMRVEGGSGLLTPDTPSFTQKQADDETMRWVYHWDANMKCVRRHRR